MKVLIFGAGERGIKLYNYLQKHSDEYQVIAFLDNNAEKAAAKFGGGHAMSFCPETGTGFGY